MTKQNVDQRPVNLNLFSIKLPIMGFASILHRISGFGFFFLLAFLLWALDQSLRSPSSFAHVVECFSNPLMKFILWVTLSALAYHVVAGVKHLIMDMGIGETLEGGRRGAVLTLIVSAVAILSIGCWIW